jgi:transcriptional regulator with XRE-family HTH domain
MRVAESNGDQELHAFATRLRELREQAGFSQESLAHAVGLTRDGYRVYEHAVRYPKSDVAVRLAARLGVSLDQLLLGR